MAGGAHIRCMLKHGHLSRSWYAGCMMLCQSNSRGLPQLLTTQLYCKETSLKGRMRVLHYIHRRERSQITLMCWCMGRVAAVEIGSTVSLSGGPTVLCRQHHYARGPQKLQQSIISVVLAEKRLICWLFARQCPCWCVSPAPLLTPVSVLSASQDILRPC